MELWWDDEPDTCICGTLTDAFHRLNGLRIFFFSFFFLIFFFFSSNSSSSSSSSSGLMNHGICNHTLKMHSVG